MRLLKNNVKKLTKDKLLRVIQILADSTDIDEVYYDVEGEDRVLMREVFLDKFLPYSDEEDWDE